MTAPVEVGISGCSAPELLYSLSIQDAGTAGSLSKGEEIDLDICGCLRYAVTTWRVLVWWKKSEILIIGEAPPQRSL